MAKVRVHEAAKKLGISSKELLEKLKAAGVEFIEVDQKPFFEATAPVRAKYGAAFAELMKRIEAVK